MVSCERMDASTLIDTAGWLDRPGVPGRRAGGARCGHGGRLYPPLSVFVPYDMNHRGTRYLQPLLAQTDAMAYIAEETILPPHNVVCSVLRPIPETAWNGQAVRSANRPVAAGLFS